MAQCGGRMALDAGPDGVPLTRGGILLLCDLLVGHTALCQDATGIRFISEREMRDGFRERRNAEVRNWNGYTAADIRDLEDFLGGG